MARIFVAAGAVLGAVAVAMAAVAAHALPHADAAGLEAVKSAIQMNGWHALALVACGLWIGQQSGVARKLGQVAGWGFLVGSLLFCGAIYGHHLLGFALGPLAPVGGVTLILAWLLLAASAASSKRVLF